MQPWCQGWEKFEPVFTKNELAITDGWSSNGYYLKIWDLEMQRYAMCEAHSINAENESHWPGSKDPSEVNCWLLLDDTYYN